jgi:NAD(P)-dependent dehydrogenase (short-subunit alcohol dehydrogenase family)
VPGFDLNGKVALVTGAARGIGFETARQLQARGASVAMVDLDAQQAREAAERIGERAVGVAADVTDDAAIRQAVAETVERFGGLDVAVANAGIAQRQLATVRSIGVEEWERVFEVDMLGVWRTVRAALPQIVERHGHIVLVSSAYAFVNGILNSPYAAAKAGVEALGRSLRAELAPLGASAGVAYFGWVDTAMVRDAAEQQHFDRMLEELPRFMRKRIHPSEAGAAVAKGIEERAPRIFAPRWWRYFSAMRGVINPLFDRRLDRDQRTFGIVREVESTADEQGAAAASANPRSSWNSG